MTAQAISPTADRPLAAAPPSPNGANADSDAEILNRFERAVIMSQNSQETFFDGWDSRFSRSFHALIDAHGVRAIDALRAYMNGDRPNGEYVGEALKELGNREDEETHAARLDILTDCLFSVSDPLIRDDVGRGIAALGDPAAISAVETALANEPTEFLQYGYALVLEDLREIEEEIRETKCRASQNGGHAPASCCKITSSPEHAERSNPSMTAQAISPTADRPLAAAPPSPNGANADSDAEILDQFKRAVIMSQNSQETFFDGWDSRFSRSFHALIDAHGVRAIDALRAYMNGDRANGEYVCEAMKQLGNREDKETHAARLDILTDCLFSVSDARIRDDISLGIAALGDPAAINAVETALANEPSESLRYSFALALEDLREIEEEIRETKCRASSE